MSRRSSRSGVVAGRLHPGDDTGDDRRVTDSVDRVMDVPAFGRVAVLGLGLIGGSLVNAIRQSGWTLSATTPIREPPPPRVLPASRYRQRPGAVHGADSWCSRCRCRGGQRAALAPAPHLAPAVLTDVGTLKAPVPRTGAHTIPTVRFVGGHPLAGTETAAGTPPIRCCSGCALGADARVRHGPGVVDPLAELCAISARSRWRPRRGAGRGGRARHRLPHVLAEAWP